MIASVGYLNARPLTDDLGGVILDHPAAIARLLAEGKVEAALVPIAAVLSDPTLRIVPGWCIGAEGPVGSVLVVAETPREQWTRLVLDGESRTSAVLARLLVARWGLAIEVVDGEPGVGRDAARGTTAALVIGDAARDLEDRLVVRVDLAAEWHRWTGLPFVFAVWAGRESLAPEVRDQIREAGRIGVASRAERFSGADLAYLTENLRYTLDDHALMGLRRFAAMAHAAGLLPHADVALFGPSRRLQRDPETAAILERVVGGERLSATDAVRLFAASVQDLGAAASVRRGEVGYGPSESVVLDVDASPEAQVAALEAIRAAQDAGAGYRAVRCRTPEGYDDAWHGGPTAIELLRSVAIARLFLDNVDHVEASGEREGRDVGQAALHMGCDDWGPGEAVETERAIREAGFAPFPRDAAYVPLGGPVTEDDGRRARRPRS